MAYLTQCGVLLKKHDPNRFFLSLFAPVEAQSAFWALGMFNFEIAKTREIVTSSTMGLIRLQWWRDALTRWYEKGLATKHEVLDELFPVIKKYNLPFAEFENLLIAREQDFQGEIQDVAAYAHDTSAPLFRLYAKILSTQDVIPAKAGIQPIVQETLDSGFRRNDTEGVEILATNYALVGLARTGQYTGEIKVKKQKFHERYFRAAEAFVSLYTAKPQKPAKFKELRVWLQSF